MMLRVCGSLVLGVALAGGGWLCAQSDVAAEQVVPVEQVAPVGQVATVTDAAGAKSAPPAVLTARLAFLTGDVQVQRADNTAPDDAALNGGTGSAAVNMPLTEGARVLAGENGQAEIEFEDGSVARLTPRTTLTIDSLGRGGKAGVRTGLSVLSGLAYFELRSAPGTAWEIDANGVSAAPEANSVLRISVDQPVTFSVISGSVRLSSQGGFNALVKANESLRPDPQDAAHFYLDEQVIESAFDSWNQSRDANAAYEADLRTPARDSYAGTEGYGWSDLDANGSWYTVPSEDGTESEIWQPGNAALDEAASADGASDPFDPYGEGAFVWTGVSYTWASAYSWGWLPYRCGLWNWYAGFGWGWSPNRFCGVRGFAGGNGIWVGLRPRRYKLVQLPLREPGPVHRIYRVERSVPPSYALPRVEGVRIAGHVATPVTTVGVSSGFVAGGALYRDFPVEAKTHAPVLGTVVSGEGSSVQPIYGSVGGLGGNYPGAAAGSLRPIYGLRVPGAVPVPRPGAPVARPAPVAPRPVAPAATPVAHPK